MKCSYSKDERYPALGLYDIGSKAKGLVDVPPKLLNAVQKAEHDLACAELAVLEHLAKTDQLPETDRSWLEVLRKEVGSRG